MKNSTSVNLLRRNLTVSRYERDRDYAACVSGTFLTISGRVSFRVMSESSPTERDRAVKMYSKTITNI